MNKNYLLTFAILCLCFESRAQAQTNAHALKFREIKTRFYETISTDREPGKEDEVEDGALERFKRWEWYWESRLDSNGEFPAPDILMKELQSYQQSHQLSSEKVASTPPWTFRGPLTSTGGYYGIGRVNCITFHPTDENTFWVGTPAGGIWKTINGGTSWTTTTDNFPVLGVDAIVVNPSNPNVLYAATGDGELFHTNSVGILKSTDGGASWSNTGLSWPITDGKLIRRLIMNPFAPDEMLAATSSGIFKTTDGWVNYTQPQSTGDFFDLEFKPGDPTHVYASTYDYWGGNTGIYTSVDEGNSWNAVVTFPGTVCRINLAVSPAAPEVVQAVCANRGTRDLNSFWKSTNSGASYSKIEDGICSNNYLSGDYPLSGFTCQGQGDYDLSFAINPQNAGEIWLGGICTWRTTNFGASWSIKNFWNSYNPPAAVVHGDKHQIAFHPLNNNKIYDCNDGGLYVTTNGGTSWTNLSNGLGITEIYRISTSATVADDVICGTQDNSTKQLKNGSWIESLATGDGIESLIDFADPSIEYGMRINGVLYKSTNGGTSWGNPIVSATGSGVNEDGEWLTPLIMNPNNHNELLIGKSQVYKSTNGGASWTQLGNISGITYGKICSMAYAPSNPQTIYVASRKEMYRSTNGGISWTQLHPNTPLDILSMAVSYSDPAKLWITQSHHAAGNRVWQSNDGGDTWSDYSGTLPAIPVNCIVYVNGSNDGLYIGTDLGVFYRDGSASDWIPYNNGLPNVIVNDLEISYVNNKLWAGTFGRGLWSSGLTIGIDENELARSVSVYPNPTEGNIFISSFAVSEPMEIEIMNVIGERIYGNTLPSGISEIDLSKEKNGVYFARIQNSHGSITKKIVLNRPE